MHRLFVCGGEHVGKVIHKLIKDSLKEREREKERALPCKFVQQTRFSRSALAFLECHL
jgi:hypothetical protein